MQPLLKKAQTLLEVNLRLMVDAVIADNDLKLLSDYIRLIERHIEEMNNILVILEYSIDELQDHIDAFEESAEIEREERRDFEQLLRETLSPTAQLITIVGSDMPTDAQIADEYREQYDNESRMRDQAIDAINSLTERMHIAKSISATIHNAFESGKPLDTDATREIDTEVTDEVRRVEQSRPAYEDDNIKAYLDYIRQQLRESRRKLRGDDY